MPNIIVLMSDEHNPLYSSVYGHPAVQTPNMERLAQLGTVFENGYCNSPLCLPSRSAFMAGKPVHQIQAYNNSNVFKHDHVSYAHVLREQGAYPVHIGKTDVWNDAERLGFAEMINPGERKAPGDTNFAREPLTVRMDGAERANRYGPKDDAFKKDSANIAEAVRWLEEQAPNMEGCWSLCVNIGAPHFPHYVTQELWDMYPNGGDLPDYGLECETAQHSYSADLRTHFQADQFKEEDVRGLRRGYLGCVTKVDEQLGRLLDTLERTGRLEDTVIIYTSDHGEMLGKFGMWWKCSLLEDSLRVPIIAAGPGFRKGARVQTPVSLFDVQASIFRAVGAVRPADWWGTPLQDIPEDDPGRAVFSEYHGHGTRSSAYMVRRGPWKLIYNMNAPHQLFNLKQDPNELRNIAESEPEAFASMKKALLSFCSPETENTRAHRFELRQIDAIGNAMGGHRDD